MQREALGDGVGAGDDNGLRTDGNRAALNLDLNLVKATPAKQQRRELCCQRGSQVIDDHSLLVVVVVPPLSRFLDIVRSLAGGTS